MPQPRLKFHFRILLRLCLWLVGALLAGLASGFAAELGPRNDLEHITLQLKWKHQFQFAGYYAAVAQGYYREAGLEVVLREAEPTRDPVEEVLQGRAEFGVGTSELMLLRAKGKPIVVLAVIYQHSPLVLLARRTPGIEDLQSLAHRPVMIEPQSAELFAYFKNEGIDRAKLDIQHHSFDVQDLVRGRVAAMSAYSTDEPFLLRQAGVDLLTFTPRAGGIDFYGDNLFTTEQQLREHPERTRAFRQASLRGWEYALAHPAEMVDLIQREHGQRKGREHLLFEASQTIQLVHPELIEVGHMNRGRWRHIADTYAEFGMVPAGFPLDRFLYDPNPLPNYAWVYWTLGGMALVALAALGWALPLYRLNRRLEQSERQYRELAENAPFPVAINELDTGRVLFANRRADGLFAGPAASLVGRPVDDLFEDPADRERLLTELRAGRSVTDLEVCLRVGDRKFWTLLSAGPVEFAGNRGLFVAFHDITARHAIEEELRRAKDAAEAANVSKSHYLAVMTHEVRTPLSGIIGLAGILQEQPLEPEVREHVRLIESTGETLNQLISNILDYSRIEAGRLDVERIPLEAAGLLHELSRLFATSAQTKKLALRVNLDPEVPPVVLTDPARLRQILSNLLSNAIKFTAQGGVELHVSFPPQTDGSIRLRFSVQDTGVGIAPERVALLFQPYAQADNSVARRYGGTGLGLAISRDLARLLGGDLTLTSVPGQGTTFILEIPVGLPVPG